MFNILYEKCHDYTKAYDRLLQFIIVDHIPPMIHQFDGKMSWFADDEKTSLKLIEIYKQHFKEIHTDRYDYLGDIYVEKQGRFSQGIKGQFLTPAHICDFMVNVVINEEEKDKPINIFDPCVGTGRFLMTASKYAPKAVLFGVDIDNRAIRTAFANACIHKARMRLLHADSLRHATDISTKAGLYNWKFCNSWQSHWN